MQSNSSLAITKYQFSGLFSEEWGKTLNPVTIYIKDFKDVMSTHSIQMP